jgi:hypothetical protein
MSVGADWLDHTTGHPISSKNASTGNPIQNDEFFDSIGQNRNRPPASACQLSPEADKPLGSAEAGATIASTRTMSEKLLSNVSTKSQRVGGRGDHFWKKYFEGFGNADNAGSHPQKLRSSFLSGCNRLLARPGVLSVIAAPEKG